MTPDERCARCGNPLPGANPDNLDVCVPVDMSADYCRLAAWRTTDPGQMAAALQVEKPEPVADGQLTLFEELLEPP